MRAFEGLPYQRDISSSRTGSFMLALKTSYCRLTYASEMYSMLVKNHLSGSSNERFDQTEGLQLK